jgi:AcrR family transcriptional regulator
MADVVQSGRLIRYAPPMGALPEHLQPVEVGRRPLEREVYLDHQRAHVIEAATGVFAKRGYRATTVDHIVDAAKIGVGTFYGLFGGKEECFLAAYEQVLTDCQAHVEAQLPPEGPFSTQICAALRALLEQIAGHPLQARLALVEVQTAGPASLARYEETIDALIPWLARVRAESPFAEELPSRLEEAVIGGLLWYLQQRLLQSELKDPRVHLADVLEIVLEPYLGTEAIDHLAAAAA